MCLNGPSRSLLCEMKQLQQIVATLMSVVEEEGERGRVCGGAGGVKITNKKC